MCIFLYRAVGILLRNFSTRTLLVYTKPCLRSHVPPACPTLDCRHRAVAISWEDPTAQMGAKTLMGQGKWEGTVTAALFLSPRTLALSSCAPCSGRAQGFPVVSYAHDCDIVAHLSLRSARNTMGTRRTPE